APTIHEDTERSRQYVRPFHVAHQSNKQELVGNFLMPFFWKLEDLAVHCIGNCSKTRVDTHEKLYALPVRPADCDQESRMPCSPQCLAQNAGVLIHPRSPCSLLGNDYRYSIALAQLCRDPTVRIHEMGVDQVEGKLAAQLVREAQGPQ